MNTVFIRLFVRGLLFVPNIREAGYPRWLAKYRPESVDDFWLRSADERHIRWSQHWFDAVCKAVADEQITRKPVGDKGIILIQIENEYNHHGCDGKEKLLKALYSSVRKSGMDIPGFHLPDERVP